MSHRSGQATTLSCYSTSRQLGPTRGTPERIETQHGLVTDVALKRKIRDYVNLYRAEHLLSEPGSPQHAHLKAFQDVRGTTPPQVAVVLTRRGGLVHGEPVRGLLDRGELLYSGDLCKPKDIKPQSWRLVTRRRQYPRRGSALLLGEERRGTGKWGEQTRHARSSLWDYFDIRRCSGQSCQQVECRTGAARPADLRPIN